jgi:hypothetical protein
MTQRAHLTPSAINLLFGRENLEATAAGLARVLKETAPALSRVALVPGREEDAAADLTRGKAIVDVIYAQVSRTPMAWPS